MKKTALLGSLCLILGISLSSCQKETVNPASQTTTATTDFSKNAMVANATASDDTYTLQNQLNAGDVTLTAGRVYNVSGFTVSHALNMNGAIINVTAAYGYPVRMSRYGASITNGTIKGTWTTAQAADPSNGAAGLWITADNCSVSHVTISGFSSYGVLCAAVNNVSFTYNVIKNIGYLGFYFDAETKNTSGGIFNHNTVDMSMLSASSASGSGIAIRASSNNPAITTSNWTINANNVKMPYNPSNWNASGIEVRYMTNSTICANTFTNGSIGCSVVRSSDVTVSWNQFSGSSHEALEFADTKSSSSLSNTITSGQVGILIDGAYGSKSIILSGDKISGTVKECIHAYTNTYDLTITGCTLTAGDNAKAINLQATNMVKIQNTIFNGDGIAAMAVMMDNCPGNLAITGGSVSNFKSSVISIYNSKAGITTSNVTMNGVATSGVPKGLVTVLEYGTFLGSNILVGFGL